MRTKSPFLQKLMPYIVCFSAALFFSYELVQLHMMNAISPFLMKDLSISATGFGNLCATYLLADVIFLLPAGMILDRFSTRKVILSALIFCILGTIGFAFAQNFYDAAICHFLSGIGNAFCFLSCMMLIAKWFPMNKQAFIVGLVITVGMLGGVIAQSPFSILAETLSWRKALIVDAICGIFIYGLIYLFVFDSPNAEEERESSKNSLSFFEGIKRSIFNRQNICCGLYTAFMNLPLMVMGAVFGSLFLTQVHSLPLSRASFIISMICFGTIIGSPLYGYFSDNTGMRRPWMYLGALLSFVIISLILFLPAPTEITLASLFFLLGFFSSSQVLGYPTITESNPKELTGTSMGIAAVIIMGLPMLVQPFAGALLDLGWDGALIDGTPFYSLENYLTSFAIFPIGFLIALGSSYLIRERKELITQKV